MAGQLVRSRNSGIRTRYRVLEKNRTSQRRFPRAEARCNPSALSRRPAAGGKTMDFERSEAQKALRDSVGSFAEKVIEPEAGEYDQKNLFPWEAFRQMGREGYLGLTVPAAYGGFDGGAMEYSILCEEIARASARSTQNGQFQAH